MKTRTSMLMTLRQCLAFLTPRERWQWVGLVPLMLLVAAMETVAAALVFELIQMLNDPTQTTHIPTVTTLSRALAGQHPQGLVLVFTLLVTVFYILKNAVLTVVAYVRSQLVSTSITSLASRLLQRYLTMPYTYHLQRNSADLISNITGSVNVVFSGVMTAAVAIASELLIMLGIITVLLVTTPFVTLMALTILGGLLAVMLKLTRRTAHRWGAQTLILYRTILQSLQQALGGVKEVRILGREGFFHTTFMRQHRALYHIKARHTLLDDVPRLLVETTFVCGVLLMVLVLTLQAQAGSSPLPLLGLHAYAGFRIIPSANRLLWRINEIRSGTAAVLELYHDYTRLGGQGCSPVSPAPSQQLALTQALVVEGVSYTYPGASTPALQDIHLTVRRCEAIGIVGPTGAGKSTLVDIITGLDRKSVV